jgi:hypothetical protein
MNSQTDEIDSQFKNVMDQITVAASKQDLATIQRLTRKASELHELKEQLAAIRQRFASLTSESGHAPVPTTNQPTNGIIRQLPIEVTDGMIRQNLLTLAPQVKSGKIKVGEELVIEALPGGERFQTELLEQGKRLRARSEIATFYRAAKVKGGDYVLLTEVTPGRWTLKKAPEGEYGVARLLRDLA